MQLGDIPQALTGDKFLEAIKEDKIQRKEIAEGLIYEKTSLLVSADPGVGKSTIATQVAIELAAGLPVFGYFNVPEPVKVMYIQAERDKLEFLERVYEMSKTYPIVAENIVVTDHYQVLNLVKPDDFDLFMKCLKRDYGGAKVIFLDPIYSMVMGGLKDDTPSSIFTKAMSTAAKVLDCALWFNHHNVKAQYDKDGNKIKKKVPFYGSQWLLAHSTGAFDIAKEDKGVKMTNYKDNYKLLAESIPLEYDSETGLCSVIGDRLDPMDRIKKYLDMREIDQKEFYFQDLEDFTKLCTRTLRKHWMHSLVQKRIVVVSTFKNKKLYKIAPKKGG